MNDKITPPELPEGMFFRVTGDWSFASASVQIRERRRFGSRLVVETLVDWETARDVSAERAVTDAMHSALLHAEQIHGHRLAAQALDALVGDYVKEEA